MEELVCLFCFELQMLPDTWTSKELREAVYDKPACLGGLDVTQDLLDTYSKAVFTDWQCCFSGLKQQTLSRLGWLQGSGADSHLFCEITVFRKKNAVEPFSGFPYGILNYLQFMTAAPFTWTKILNVI